MTALPAGGFAFGNWTVSTNFMGGTATNKPTLRFMMATNLTLQASFAETAKPALRVLSPASGTREPGAVATVTGIAQDVWGIAAVAYQLDDGAWINSFTTNGFTNWSATVELSAGTNVLNIYAMNLGGNYSPTNSLRLISTNAVKLQFGLVSRPKTGRGFNLNLKLSPGLSGRIEVSTNLIDWNVLTNFSETNGTITIYDPNATSPQRFYRAITP
ncbi:MAG: InlB B-repeat-containing protein, partial [Limisphaerales bacterium]